MKLFLFSLRRFLAIVFLRHPLKLFKSSLNLDPVMDRVNYNDAEEICMKLSSIWENHNANVTYIRSKCFGRLPFVTISYAQSIDGMIASTVKIPSSYENGLATSSNLKISCDESLIVTHALRSIHDAVLIGGRTLSIDNPQLNNRYFRPFRVPFLTKQPIAVVIDSELTHVRRLVQDYRLNDSQQTFIRANNLIICCSHAAARRTLRWQLGITSGKKIRLLGCKTNADGTLDLVDVLVRLKSKGINSVLVEGGSQVLSSFMTYHRAKNPITKIIDMFVITISPTFVGAISGLSSFSKFNSLNDDKLILPSLNLQSPLSFIRNVGSDLIIGSPMNI